ncbi:unnamed protein product [Diamesa serratosioi]
MADSFFGFNSALPRDDDVGSSELREECYDALNDETFSSAINDDWEHGHEDLARIDIGNNTKNHVGNNNNNVKQEESDVEYDSDLDINFITKMDDFEIANDDNDVRNQFQLDPGVWTSPVKPLTPNNKVQNSFNNNNHYTEHEILRQNYALQQQQHMQHPIQQQPPQLSLAQQTSVLQQFIGATPPAAPSKMLSLEDIERNMINQQQHQQQQKIIQENLAALQAKASVLSQQQIQQAQMRKMLGNATNSQQQPQTQPQQQPQPLIYPPPHPLMNGPPPPAGFPPVPPHLQGPNMTKFNPMMNMANHPMNMNNFVHPYGGLPLRPGQMPPLNRMPPHLMNLQHVNPQLFQQLQQQNAGMNSAQFNQRLVQEIQQNHPLLNPMYNRQIFHPNNQPYPYNMQYHNNNNNNGNNNNNNNNHQRYTGNLKMEEFDEYANLMSNRDKQFLITIQLMQLNTETPYFDDYYYTMYKERQKLLKGKDESQTHKDNQMNHPFTQPRGHAQMLLRQFGSINKNGMNQKNGMNRERKNSESSTKNEKENPTPRTYTPLQFENSLGKLQCGSVNAPRKIIDMEIMENAENGGQGQGVAETTTQKKSRQLLMHIETMYKIVLKLDDLQHPLAISATFIIKEKREKERREQEMRDEFDETPSKGGSTKSSISISDGELTREDLLLKLLTMLPMDKITGMMTVRKGRNLLKRIFPHIKEQPIRWEIWNAVFLSLTLFKRDKLEEIEDSLMAMYYEFAVQLQDAEFKDVLKIVTTIGSSQKLIGYVNGCKFVVSSIIAMIIKSELIYHRTADSINSTDEQQWIDFLNKLIDISNTDRTVDAQILSSANNVSRDKNDNDKIIKTVIAHFHRFKARFTSDTEKLVKLLAIQYDVK